MIMQWFRHIVQVLSKPVVTSFKCAFLPANQIQTPPVCREFVEGAISLVDLPCSPSVASCLKYIGILLQTEDIAEISKFYYRDPCAYDWYYQAYGAACPNQTHNSVASIIKERKESKVCGDVVIVKNGPLGGLWESYPDINMASLSGTLWWYRQSGRDLSTVFGERGFLRMVGDISES